VFPNTVKDSFFTSRKPCLGDLKTECCGLLLLVPTIQNWSTTTDSAKTSQHVGPLSPRWRLLSYPWTTGCVLPNQVLTYRPTLPSNHSLSLTQILVCEDYRFFLIRSLLHKFFFWLSVDWELVGWPLCWLLSILSQALSTMSVYHHWAMNAGQYC
jgi:hypothetical protein